jgi:hypothetical protein
VVILLAATLLVLLNVPGRYVPYVDFEGSRYSVNEQIGHGWPWLYLTRDEWPASGTWNMPEPNSVWSLLEDVVKFKPLILALDVAVACVLFMVTAVGFEWWRRQRSRVLQVRLTDLLGGTAAIAIVVAYSLSMVREFKQERETMRDLGYLQLEYDPGEHTPAWVSGWARGGPAWARPFLGQHDPKCFDRVVQVNVHDDGTLFEHLAALRHLRVVNMDGRNPEWNRNQIAVLAGLHHLEALQLPYWPDRLKNNGTLDYAPGDAEFARTLGPLEMLPRLRALNVEDSLFGNQCAAVISRFSHLCFLKLRATQLNDDGLEHIAKIGTLEELDLEWTSVTDAGIRHLTQLIELRELNLDRTSVHGPGLAHLTNLTKLRLIELPHEVDRAAVKNLQRRMPQLKIVLAGEQFHLE